MCTKFRTYNTTIDQDISQSLVFYFIVDTVYIYIYIYIYIVKNQPNAISVIRMTWAMS